MNSSWVKKMSVELKTIFDKYLAVFKEELGTMKGTEVHINLASYQLKARCETSIL